MASRVYVSILILVICSVDFVTALPLANPTTKRSYSVAPLVADGTCRQPTHNPWPRIAGPTQPYQPVRYCFKDKRSVDNLNGLVSRAIELWTPAMLGSALRIDLDPECNGDPYKLCSELDQHTDALMISDETIDANSNWNWNDCETGTTLGYSCAQEDDSDGPGRHVLEFCHLVPGDESTRPNAIRTMAHELGHAIGLQHEHQRPDRDEYLDFKCEHLIGYDEARHAADLDAEAMFDDDDDDIDAKMRLVCSEFKYAKAYFPGVLPCLKGDRMDGGILDEQVTEMWAGYHVSGPFDYDSIMIYNSHANTKAATEYVFARKDTGGPVWQGGSKQPEGARVSPGDIARVSELYPLQ